MSNNKSSTLRAPIFSFVGLEGVRTGLVAVHRTQAQRSREALEEEARRARRNLANPTSYARIAARVAKSG